MSVVSRNTASTSPSTKSSSNPTNKALTQRMGDGFNKQDVQKKFNFAKDFGNAFGENLYKTGIETGKSVLRSPLRVATSLAEIPRTIGSKGAKTFNPYKVPGLGEIKTYSREAKDRIKGGESTAGTILGVGGQAILDTAAMGSVAKGLKSRIGGVNKAKWTAPKSVNSIKEIRAKNVELAKQMDKDTLVKVLKKTTSGTPGNAAGDKSLSLDQLDAIHNSLAFPWTGK